MNRLYEYAEINFWERVYTAAVSVGALCPADIADQAVCRRRERVQETSVDSDDLEPADQQAVTKDKVETVPGHSSVTLGDVTEQAPNQVPAAIENNSKRQFDPKVEVFTAWQKPFSDDTAPNTPTIKHRLGSLVCTACTACR